jgi:nitrile hydratase accessory protein
MTVCKSDAPAQAARDALAATHPIPHDDEGPVFAEPWQARAFAFAVELHAKGAFTWPEWADALSRVIKQAQAQGDPDLGDTYWDHWLLAVERIVAEKQIASAQALQEKAQAWARAAQATPHGQPILLDGREG